jgi:hypothetical protein
MARSIKIPHIATIASEARITMGQLIASFMDPR